MSDKPLTHSQLFGPYAGPTGIPDPLVESSLTAFLASLDESSIADPETLKEGRYRIAMRHVLATLGLQWISVEDRLPEENGDGYEILLQYRGRTDFVHRDQISYTKPGILITEPGWEGPDAEDHDEKDVRYWRRPQTIYTPNT